MVQREDVAGRVVVTRAAIVIPTLDIGRAARTGALAQEMAGVRAAVIIVADAERRGGTIPTNAGYRAALDLGAEYIVYLNDDATPATDAWLRRMIEALNEQPDYGIACPSGHCRGGVQRTAGPGADPGVFVVNEPLAWFCAVLRRKVLEDVGLFNRAMIHYAADSDLTRRAQAAGWKSVWVRDVYFVHDPGEPIRDWWEHDLGEYRRLWPRGGR